MSQSHDSSPDPPELPAGYENATGKGDIRIPGAGSFFMGVLLISLSILFGASLLALLLIRSRSPQWPPVGFPHLPHSLWISTALILIASVFAQSALRAIRRDDDRGLVRDLTLTFLIGLLFLVLQTFNWVELLNRIQPPLQIQGAYLGMFYVLTALHAAHVLGGLIPLGILLYRAHRKRYSRNFHPGVRYCTIYWHFLDIVWVILFLTLYF